MSTIIRISKIAIAAGALVLACLGTAAVAFWTAGGSGTASAGVGTLSAPGKPSGSPGAGISLSWGAGSVSGGGAVSYHVQRRSASGSIWSDACGSSAAAPISGTSCVDTGATGTEVVYRVTAVFRSWTARGPESEPIAVDGISPDVTVERKAGQADPTSTQPIRFTVSFSEPVSDFDESDVTVGGTAGGGSASVTGSGSTYEIAVSGLTSQGTVTASVAADRAHDAAGNGNTASTSADNSVLYDTEPVVTGVDSSLADGSYDAGTVIPVRVAFSEAVNVTGSPRILLETGSTDRFATYAGGNGTSTLTFNYTISAGDTSSDLDYVATNSLSLNGGTIRDASLNDAVLTLPALGSPGSLAGAKDIVVDTSGPTVAGVSSTLANGTYGPGTVVPVTVTFSEAVDVTGSPRILLETGSTDRFATYAGGSGTGTLTFNYTIVSGDSSSDLNYTSSSSSLSLNGGTIRDLASNNASLSLPSLGSSQSLGGSKSIVVDGIEPEVDEVSSTIANGSYKAGVTIPVTVRFDSVVEVTGTPLLRLETGSTDRDAVYAGGSGTNTLTFEYEVQPGDSSNDLNYQSTSALSLNGGTIRDAVGNDADLGLPSSMSNDELRDNKNIVIDTSAPFVDEVDSNTSSGAYGVGRTISIQVDFNQSVVVEGAPQLLLETGDTDRIATYSGGSGSSSLSFAYVVQPGDASSDLNYVGTDSLSLNGGAIRDLAGNDAVLTLPATNSGSSLAGNKSLVVETVAPALQSLRFVDNDDDGRVDALQATFDEALSSSGDESAWVVSGSIPGGGTMGSVGTSGSVATYTINEGSVTTAPTANWLVQLNASATGIRDVAGNQASFAAQAPADGAGPIPTAIADSDSSPSNSGRFQAGDSMTVTFSENVIGVGSSSNVLLTGGSGGGPGGNDSVSMSGLLSGSASLGASNYISGNGSVASFLNSALSQPQPNQVRVTLGACTSSPSSVCTSSVTQGSTGNFTFTPVNTITDAAGNAAHGSLTVSIRLF